jgi:SNW domain-containing protein 1
MWNELAIQLDHEGEIEYDAIARQGLSKNKVIYSKHTDLVPQEVMNTNNPDLQRPNEETIKEITEKIRVTLQKIISMKVAVAMTTHIAAQYIHYTPSQQGEAFNSGAKQGYSDGRNAERPSGASKV